MRLTATAVVGFSTVRFADARAYQLAAESLAETGRYPFKTDTFYFRPPGYSAFIAIVTLGHPERVVVAKVANAVAASLATLILAALATRLFRKRSLGLATGIAAALDPSLVLVSTDLQSEPIFLLLLTAAGFFLLAAVDRPSSNLALGAGVLLGLAALVRPSALAVAPLLLAPLLDRRYPVRARAHLAASAVLGFFLSVAPWTLRNAVVYREFIPISDVGGFNFYLGNSDQMLGFFSVRTRQDYKAWADETDRLIAARIAELKAAGITSPGAVTRALVRQAIVDGLSRPAVTARLLLLKSWDWLRFYPNPLFWPRTVVLGVGVLYLALYVLTALGLVTAPRRGVSVFALAVVVLSMAAHVLTVVSWRYRVPYWDPVMLLYGVFGASRMRGTAINRTRASGQTRAHEEPFRHTERSW